MRRRLIFGALLLALLAVKHVWAGVLTQTAPPTSLTLCDAAQAKLGSLYTLGDDNFRRAVLDVLDYRFPITLFLKPSDESIISEIFERVSKPEYLLTPEERSRFRSEQQRHPLLKRVRGYGQYLTLKELAQVSAPRPEVLKEIKHWLARHLTQDIPGQQSLERGGSLEELIHQLHAAKFLRAPIQGDGSIVQLRLTYKQIERMFDGVTMNLWFSKDSSLGKLLVNESLYDNANVPHAGRLALLQSKLSRPTLLREISKNSILIGAMEDDSIDSIGLRGFPIELVREITLVHGLRPKFRHYLRGVASGQPVPRLRHPSLAANDDPNWTPATLCSFLGFSSNALVTARNAQLPHAQQNVTAQSVLGTLHQTFIDSDVEVFVSAHGLPANAKIIRGGDSDAGADNGNEAELDVQWILATTFGCPGAPSDGISTYFLYFDGYSAFLDWISYIAANPEVGQVHSASFDDIEYSDDPSYRAQLNNEFKKAGVRGLTLLFASGDEGTGCRGTGGRKCNKFAPEFPASSPYVTTVGGTTLVEPYFAAEAQSRGQEVYGSYASGGGFSEVFARADYQKSAVEGYLNLAKQQGKLPSSSYFNASGRAYPDLAAPLQYYPTYINGKERQQAGTSAAAPVVAGLITRLNLGRAKRGQPPVGFANPLMYSIAAQDSSAFIDAIGGHNDGIPIDGSCSDDGCGQGFYALEGWDPVTGLGVPQFDVLLKHVLRQDLYVVEK